MSGTPRFRRLGRALRSEEDARQPPIPVPDAGPFKRSSWRSPLRDLWTTSMLSSALLPLIVICAVTGFLSHAAYDPDLGVNGTFKGFEDELYFFDWPTSPVWLYAVNQSLHVLSGLTAIPILLAKLWAVLPKLWERPVVRSISHAIERLSLVFLVGGALFVFLSGVYNIQYWYAWLNWDWLPMSGFGFVPAHYYAAILFIAALAVHVLLKLPTMAEAFREHGVLRPLRISRKRTESASPDETLAAPTDPQPATISRRGLLGVVGGASLGVLALSVGQSFDSIRSTALLAPRGRTYGSGPNDFQINATAERAKVTREMAGSSWRLELRSPNTAEPVKLSRDDLLGLPLSTQDLPIACVEGWVTWQTWTGVPLRDLARIAGIERPELLLVESLQPAGAFRKTSLNGGQVRDPRSLLALRVNGADLSLDHGFPARIIVPALPGVHNTKWVSRMTFEGSA